MEDTSKQIWNLFALLKDKEGGKSQHVITDEVHEELYISP